MSPYVSPVGLSRYWQWLQATTPCASPMAWCHTTDTYALRSMIETGVLTPRLCKVFDEYLSYFFYGRPALRRAIEPIVDTGGRAPVVIVMDPGLATDGVRLFPFDTGAFASGRYNDWMHRAMQLSDFELASLSDGAQRHVTAHFGTNDRYLRLETRRPTASFVGSFEVQSVVSLLTDRNTATSDDRRGTLELQVTRQLPFEHPLVRAIVLPEKMLRASYVQDFLYGRGARIQIETYPLMPLRDAREYQFYLEAIVRGLQEKWGLV